MTAMVNATSLEENLIIISQMKTQGDSRGGDKT